MALLRSNQRTIWKCVEDVVTVGFSDTNCIGCVASQVVLFLPLGVVGIRFVMAIMFQWFFSWKLGNFLGETDEQHLQHSAEIENWTTPLFALM